MYRVFQAGGDFVDTIKAGITALSDFLWNGPLTILLIGTGLYLTFITGGLCIRTIPKAFKMMFEKGEHEGEITPFQALSTALAATVGTGNIVGVATAIGIGGPGAIFWMWIVAILGVTTKYAESLLAVHYRTKSVTGAYIGGPMYYIEKGMGAHWKWLAILFCIGAMFAAFVTGNMVQANSVAGAIREASLGSGLGGEDGIPKVATGVVLAIVTFLVIIGGIKGIGKIASKLVPSMAILYVVFVVIILFQNAAAIPGAFMSIINYAWSGDAAAGGFIGAMVVAAIRAGVARGIYSNEAGQGSAPMAHAAASIKDHVTQARVAMLGTVIDTLIICSMTALVILTMPGLEFNTISAIGDGSYAGFSDASQELSLVIYQGQPVSKNSVSTLTSIAFSSALPAGAWIIALTMIVFAFTTILGWSYYGERALDYLCGGITNFIPFRVVWCLLVLVGAVMKVDFIWRLADVGTAAMTAPNLIAVLALSGLVVKLTREHDQAEKNSQA